jgi:hypothetical protein
MKSAAIENPAENQLRGFARRNRIGQLCGTENVSKATDLGVAGDKFGVHHFPGRAEKHPIVGCALEILRIRQFRGAASSEILSHGGDFGIYFLIADERRKTAARFRRRVGTVEGQSISVNGVVLAALVFINLAEVVADSGVVIDHPRGGDIGLGRFQIVLLELDPAHGFPIIWERGGESNLRCADCGKGRGAQLRFVKLAQITLHRGDTLNGRAEVLDGVGACRNDTPVWFVKANKIHVRPVAS